MKRIVFGGDKLQPGSHTWYDTPSTTPAGYARIRADPGDEVPAGDVYKHVGDKPDGSPILQPNAEYYVNAGMASYVKDSKGRGRQSARIVERDD